MNNPAKNATIVVIRLPNNVQRAVRPMIRVMNNRIAETMYIANIQCEAVRTRLRLSWTDCGTVTVWPAKSSLEKISTGSKTYIGLGLEQAVGWELFELYPSQYPQREF
jgi:hypothetical protein